MLEVGPNAQDRRTIFDSMFIANFQRLPLRLTEKLNNIYKIFTRFHIEY